MVTLGEISAILAMVAAGPYIYQIFKMGVKPERASWFVWTVLLAISFVSQRAAGGGDSLGLVIGDIVATCLIFGVSIFKGTGGLSRFDLTCLGLAAVGVIVWQAIDLPVIATAAVIFADAMGSLPTIRKGYYAPQSESRVAFSITTAAALFGLLAVGELNFNLAIYPAYILVANLAIVVACQIGYKVGNHKDPKVLEAR